MFGMIAKMTYVQNLNQDLGKRSLFRLEGKLRCHLILKLQEELQEDHYRHQQDNIVV